MGSLTGSHAFDLGASPEPEAPAWPNPEYIHGQAVIGWKSALDAFDASIAASSQAAGFAGENVRSRVTYSGWKPTAGGAQTLTFTFDHGQTVDYLGIAAHNLFSKAASFDFQWSDDGGAWTSLLGGGNSPVSDAPILLMLDSTAKRHFRLVVNVSGLNFPTVGVVMFGQRLELQRGIYVGHRPAPYSRIVEHNTRDSEGGQILGRSVVRRMNETDIQFGRITPAWFRSHLVPFLRQAEEEPFFFLWRKAHAREVIFGAMSNDPRPSNDHQNFMAVDLNIRGLA